ncbi:sugar ABC transporter substrate-binding protein [Streptomyces sp. NPDC058665]|uniref:sugar ABC transporter substrate-binding protein n=1 Tax=Streptomyces sp. NPDC058665 TaxID=3346586 RepID=UPI00365FE39C
MSNRFTTFRRPAAFAAVVAFAATALSACSSGSATESSGCAKQYSIGFSHPVGESEFAAALKKQVTAAGAKQGCVKVLLDNTQASNLESQRATIESWMAQKVDAIVVLAVDATALDGLREQAQAQGTKWLTYAGGTKTSDGSVGFDNVQSGDLVAKDAIAWWKKTYPQGGVTAEVTTLTPLVGFKGRWEEPLKQFSAAGLDVVSKQDCADQECGLQITEDALRQHPNLRVVVGINDDAAIGALKAFTNKGIDPSKVYIAGQDGTREGLEAVKAAGAYRSSAAILIPDLAKSIIDNSIAAITGKGSTDYETPVVLATARDPKQLDQLIQQYGK